MNLKIKDTLVRLITFVMLSLKNLDGQCLPVEKINVILSLNGRVNMHAHNVDNLKFIQSKVLAKVLRNQLPMCQSINALF